MKWLIRGSAASDFTNGSEREIELAMLVDEPGRSVTDRGSDPIIYGTVLFSSG